MSDPSPTPTGLRLLDADRYELALRRVMGCTCERSTSGIGSCWRNARSATAYFGEEQACASCVAHRALYPEAEMYRAGGFRD